MGHFKPQDLSKTAWAFATAGISSASLFEALATEMAARVRARARDLSPQSLSDTAWAFAAANISAPALFEAIAAESVRAMRDFGATCIADLAWGFATAGSSHPLLFETMAGQARACVRTFNPPSLANTAWAYAKAGVSSPPLFEAIAAEARAQMRQFKPKELARVAWAFATAEIGSPTLFEAIAAETVKTTHLLSQFKPRELADTAWAFATVGVDSPALFEAIAVEALKKQQIKQHDLLAKTGWAFAACSSTSKRSKDLLIELLGAVISAGSLAELPTVCGAQIYQMPLFLKLSNLVSSESAKVEAELRCKFRANEPASSSPQVAASLSRIGWVHKKHETPEGFSLSMAQPEEELAVELDGPSRYLRDVAGGVGGPKGSVPLLKKLG